jgi:hypothetical protein
MRLVAWVVILLLGSISALAAEGDDEPHKIYECTDAAGNTVYQDDPRASRPPAPAAEAGARRQDQAGKKSKPGSKPASAPAPAPARVPVPQAAPLRFVVPKTAPPVFPSRELPKSNRSIDGRWQTPDTTLKTFVAAVAAGDRPAIVACLSDSALADWGPEPGELPLDALRKTVGSFTGYVAEGDLGPYWSIRALRTGMRPKWIFFERNGDGEWKIGAL